MSRCFLALILTALAASTSQGAIQVVNSFGDNGWYSWDTRNTAGTRQVGSTSTSPLWTGLGGPPSPAADVVIAQQIKFLGEGVVAPAVGGALPASPATSLNGLGYVRLDGTSNGNGKSDISYVSGSAIAAASALADPSFTATYRYFTDGALSNRTPGLNIAMFNNANPGSLGDPSAVLTFNHVQSPYTANAWNTESVSNSSLFSLYGSGAPGGATSMSLADWFADATWGQTLANYSIYRVGFNIGSGQTNGIAYLDWLETSLLNGGDTIDFQAVPEPASMIVWSLMATGVGAVVWNARRKCVPSA
jgi:hypothetical protein